MESSPPPIVLAPSLAGTKRPSPSNSHSHTHNHLLPPFHPLSSSPALPRPFKRAAVARHDYPTPLPTSSTHILSSSSPPHNSHKSQHIHHTATSITAVTALNNKSDHDGDGDRDGDDDHNAQAQRKRGPLTRTESTASERTPLSPVPCISLPLSGQPVSLGRSSLSCDFQLPPSNRSISRVHVQAAYIARSHPKHDREAIENAPPERVEIRCTGWNGITVYVQDQSYDLAKGMTFTSDIKGADVMLDVQGSRVLIQWPAPARETSPYPETVDADADEDEDESVHGEADATQHDLGAPSSSQDQSLGLQTSPLRSKNNRSAQRDMLLPPSSPVLLPHTAATGTASAAHARVNSTAAPAGNVRAADSDAVAMSFMTPSSPVVVYEDHEHERTSPAPARDNQRQQQQRGRDEVEEEDDDQENMHARVHPHHAQTYTRDDNASSDYEPDELSELDDDEYDDEDMDLDVFSSQHQYQQHARENQHQRQNSRGSGSRSRSRGITSSNGHARSGSRDSSTASRRQQSRKNTASTSRSKSRASTKHDPTNNNGHEDVSSEEILSNIPSATIDAIRNHAINQLAFSRLNSAPLSTILNHLPPEYRIPLANPHSPSTTDPTTTTPVLSPAEGKPGRTEIRHIIETTPCIGVVNREGKDAAGKPLESEYYYIPDADGDEVRSVAVTRELMKPGLRSCRKQHKQYYWRKPK